MDSTKKTGRRGVSFDFEDEDDVRPEETELSSRFADSVDAYTVHDLQNMERARQRSQVISLLLRCAVIAVCISVLGYSAYQIIDKVMDNRRSAAAYEALQIDASDYITIPHSKALKEPNGMPTVLQMLDADGVYEDYVHTELPDADRSEHYAAFYANFLTVANTYPNVYAWIYMSDTRVNYPVMKCSDNDYYLTHNYEGKESRSGSIFADRSISDNYYSNYNMVLYGHNMKDRTMFHTVKEWCNSSRIKTLVQTTQIEIYTREGLYIYNILAYYVDNSNRYATTYFSSDSDYLNFLNDAVKKSKTKTNKEYTADSRICTLITCTNGSDGDSRYVVHGILNQFIPFGATP